MSYPDVLEKSTVLVVDDTPDDLALFSFLLGHKFQVKVADNGLKAIEIATGVQPPELILLDIMMPDMDGYEVCRRLKADRKTRDIPVIFLTVRSELEEEQKGFDLGAVDYICKPVSTPILLARVSAHLAVQAASNLLRENNKTLEQAQIALTKNRRMHGDVREHSVEPTASSADVLCTNYYAEKPVVLVVDDSADDLHLINSLLKGEYQVKVAQGGEKALMIAGSDHPPDLILLDVMMPGMDGYEVCQRLKSYRRTHDIPVIFLTAVVDVGKEQKGFELGAVDFISKPINPAILLARIKTHLVVNAAFNLLREKNNFLELEVAREDFIRQAPKTHKL